MLESAVQDKSRGGGYDFERDNASGTDVDCYGM